MTFGLNSDCESTCYHIIIFLILPGIMKKERKYEKLMTTADGHCLMLKTHMVLSHDYMVIPFFMLKKQYISQT
jgi:hypothetical protein